MKRFGIYFVYRTQMKQKEEQKPWNSTKQIFAWIENKEVFSFTSSVSGTRSIDPIFFQILLVFGL